MQTTKQTTPHHFDGSGIREHSRSGYYPFVVELKQTEHGYTSHVSFKEESIVAVSCNAGNAWQAAADVATRVAIARNFNINETAQVKTKSACVVEFEVASIDARLQRLAEQNGSIMYHASGRHDATWHIKAVFPVWKNLQDFTQQCRDYGYLK